MLGNLNKGRKSYEKISFLKNVKTFLKAREDVLNNFKSNLFPINNLMSDAAPYATTRHTESEKSELIENFIDEIRNDEKKNYTMKYLTNILDIKIHFFSKYFIDKKKQ